MKVGDIINSKNVRSLLEHKTRLQQCAQEHKQQPRSDSSDWLCSIFEEFSVNYEFFDLKLDNDMAREKLIDTWLRRLNKYTAQDILDALDDVMSEYPDKYPNVMQYEKVIIERAEKRREQNAKMFTLNKSDNTADEKQHWLRVRDMLKNQPDSAMYQCAVNNLRKLGVEF